MSSPKRTESSDSITAGRSSFRSSSWSTEEHRHQVRYSSRIPPPMDEHTLHGTSVDISPGGMGFTCSEFVPRQCAKGHLRVFDPMPVGMRSPTAHRSWRWRSSSGSRSAACK